MHVYWAAPQPHATHMIVTQWCQIDRVKSDIEKETYYLLPPVSV